MEKITQHQKIINLCLDGEFHCQNSFRNLYIFSPHKRRKEIENEGKYMFFTRKCEHGVRGQFDYKMVERQPIVKLEKVKQPEQLQIMETYRRF